jgi:integrase
MTTISRMVMDACFSLMPVHANYLAADREWGWSYVFPAIKRSVDPRSGIVRRRHLSKDGVHNAVKHAARTAPILKPVSCDTLRHSFATHLPESDYNIRTIQELIDHRDVKTPMLDTRVITRGGLAVRSPLDR